MTPEKVSELRAAWNNPERDEVYHIIFRNLSYFADQYLSTPPSPYEIRDGIRLLYVCQENTDHIIDPVYEIETEHGIKGYATVFAYTDEAVEEISLDLPGEQHALLNVHFWWRLDRPYDEALYEQVKSEILRSLQAI